MQRRAHAHQPGGRSVPSAYLKGEFLYSLSFAILLSCGQTRRWFRFARTNPVIRTDQTGFRVVFRCRAENLIDFCLIPIAPAISRRRNCRKVHACRPLNRARMCPAWRSGYAPPEWIINIDMLHQVSAITDNVCLLIIAEKCMIYVARRLSRGAARSWKVET